MSVRPVADHSKSTLKNAAQGVGPNWRVELAFSSEVVTLPADEALDCLGFPFVMVYNTAGDVTIVSVSHDGVDFFVLNDRTGTAVVVGDGDAQLVEVRGATHVSFNRIVDARLVT